MSLLDKPRKLVRGAVAFIARFLDKLSGGRITPDMVTWTGVIAHVPIALLIGYGKLELAGVLLIFFGLFDVLDGELARYKKVASPRGMVLDASTDRIKEVLVYSAAAYYISQTIYYSWAWVPVLALGTILTVTYVKAKGEVAYAISRRSTDHHQVNRHFHEGLVPFEARSLLIIAGIFSDNILLACGVIAVLGTVSTIERVRTITDKVG